jgi:hypothetical protein
MFFKAFIAIACTGFVVATSAQAQEFPSKYVTLMMPYAAGGPGDTLTRIIGQGMGKVLGRLFLVENVALVQIRVVRPVNRRDRRSRLALRIRGGRPRRDR